MTWVITKQQKFYLHEDESLLEGLIRTGHDIEYQCKEGYCGSCRTRVISNNHAIDYEKGPLALINEDEILPCCCKIKGQIKLDL